MFPFPPLVFSGLHVDSRRCRLSISCWIRLFIEIHFSIDFQIGTRKNLPPLKQAVPEVCAASEYFSPPPTHTHRWLCTDDGQRCGTRVPWKFRSKKSRKHWLKSLWKHVDYENGGISTHFPTTPSLFYGVTSHSLRLSAAARYSLLGSPTRALGFRFERTAGVIRRRLAAAKN